MAGDFPAVEMTDPAEAGGLEIAGNTIYGGNGAIVTAGTSAVALDRANSVVAQSDGVPPRPSPEVPSIYEWEKAARRQAP